MLEGLGKWKREVEWYQGAQVGLNLPNLSTVIRIQHKVNF